MKLVETTSSMADEATDLFLHAYRAEESQVPSLPPNPLSGRDELRGHIAKLLTDGVAVLEGGRLAGYLCTGYRFPFKGTLAGLCPVIGHSVLRGRATELYPPLYAAVARTWAREEARLHIVEHLAHDAALERLLYRLGFGLIIRERVRDLSPVPVRTDRPVVRVDFEMLVQADAEHAAYYGDAPVFVRKTPGPAAAAEGLRALSDAGCAFFASLAQGVPVGYCIVGPQSNPEGLLMRGTTTAQVHSAYVRGPDRRTGIGTALLAAAVAHARTEGFERIFVEHESANLPGSAFWAQHFTRYVSFSMRYVDIGKIG